jgi:hypothetical protein
LSSIQIAGNTSGTITLDAPNIAGTTVLTLPTANGTILTTANTFAAGTGPAFRAGQPSAQTLTNNTWTKISFSTETFDTNNNYDNVTNYRFTPTIAGYYQVNLRINLDGGGSSGTAFAVNIYKNGVETSTNFGASLSGGFNGSQVSDVFYMNGSTDYLEPYALQNSGTSKNLVPSIATNTFSAAMIRSA